jgi:hypothetical protein
MPDEVSVGPVENPESERESLEPKEPTVEEQVVDDGKGKPAGDPRFVGKSPEELISIINEQNRYIGRQGNALGEVQALKQNLAELQNYVVQATQQREQPRQVQPQEPEFDLTNPRPYFQNMLNRELGARDQYLQQMEQQRQAQEQQRIMSEAQVNYLEGREAAMGQNPELFEGIEADVETAIRQSFASRIISPAMLRSPKTWNMAAKVLRIERGEDDKLATRRSVKPVGVEKPGRSASIEDDEIILDEQDRKEMREQGWTEKEAKENIRYALKARQAGLQVDRRN